MEMSDLCDLSICLSSQLDTSTSRADSESQLYSCKVKLAGTNILEGVKQCVSLDCLCLPVPKPVANMPSYASNCVTITDIHTDTGDIDK